MARILGPLFRVLPAGSDRPRGPGGWLSRLAAWLMPAPAPMPVPVPVPVPVPTPARSATRQGRRR